MKKYKVRLEKTKVEICVVLVEAVNPVLAEQDAVAKARYMQWQLTDVNTKAVSTEEDHGSE